ncbi:MAG: nitroreductase family protein [Bacteroidales bacterium]
MEINDIVKAIMSRRSIRSFLNLSVKKSQLEQIIKAGMAAPSARNMQPWSFIVVTDRAMLDKLGNKLPYAKMLLEATAAIIVCGVPDKAGDSPAGYWVQDCSAATQNILLAIEALGLGAVWTGVYPREDRIAIVREVLEIPEGIFPLNVIPLGYPKGEHQPKDKFKPENIHWEKW